MTYIAVISLVFATLSLIVALRAAVLSYKLHAEAIRRDVANFVEDNLARIDRANFLLAHVNASGLDAQERSSLELPSLSEMEASLQDFSVMHGNRSNSEMIGMRETDYEFLHSIRAPLLLIERRLDAFSTMVGQSNASGTA
ncbi:hypothetical protein [Pseudoxanthomonas composti]|uniref:Uncharacterized protein n=1 Tax=Pseudoxanthomonas composti TaxID=2137479 RepID=A0A4Q1JXE0_9GAMM|nr:hypothetical protein [Pseudoxanthomonas composti]RXR05972.1 hypothetical protein EPA99_08975 [Pseudoxanthomonas composti]